MTEWVNVLITKENVSGAVMGIYTMTDFQKGETYRIDRSLAEVFFDMGVAALNLKSDEIPGGPLILHVRSGRTPYWVQERKDDEQE